MERTKIAQLFADKERLGGQTVTVSGWARTIRDMKGFGFVELNDGSCFKNLQIVLDANALDNYKEIAGQNVGATIRRSPGRTWGPPSPSPAPWCSPPRPSSPWR